MKIKTFMMILGKKSKELAGKYKFVLKTDITDFYNQIYVHRLQNAIESVETSFAELSKDIEQFVLNLNSSASKGIPVGPAASIVFSESIMIGVDIFLTYEGFEFTRYVDDIRVFCDNETKLNILLQKLTVYLYENHRLNLSALKTEIKDTFSFFLEDLDRPEDKEKQKQHSYLSDISQKLLGNNLYSENYVSELTLTDLSDENQKKLVIGTLYSLLAENIQKEKFDIPLAKHILKRAKSLRIRVIFPLILENFELFTPIMREVCLYLDAILTERCISDKRSFWEQVLYRSEVINIAYAKNWIDWLIAKNISYFSDSVFKSYLDNMDFCWRIKANAEKKNSAFIKTLKVEYDSHGIWGNMAILQVFSLLPKSERKAYLRAHLVGARKTEEFLINAISQL